MISADRFIAPSSDNLFWLAARTKGVTATAVAKAATPSGFTDVVGSWGVPVESNAYMDWGRERERVIAYQVKERFGVLPNEWLIQSDEFPWAMATPDGLSPDHSMISEIKTGGKEFTSIPIQYRRQIQWQLFVTGAHQCVFAFEQRLEGASGFVPAWDIHFEIVERDERMMRQLIDTAEELWKAVQ